ncbi:MAG: hypothetical protein J6X71_01145 [Bacteroidales bacterium]|nr:hypothetical protein [Bacteroidales bacterium]
MRLYRHIIIAVAALAAATAALPAQTFHQGLFLDGYRLGYRYNPAIQNENGVVGVGQWGNQTLNNVGAANFLYPRDGKLVTALHSSVTADEFLLGLPDYCSYTGGIDFNLFSYGWRKDAAYHTVEANVRAAYGAFIPETIFEILKLGTSNTNYDMGKMRLFGNAYAELVYGYSLKVSDAFSFGARAKLLIGVEALNYNFSRMDLTFSEEGYNVDLQADLNLTSRWSKIMPDANGYLNFLDLSLKERWKLPSGGGLAVDLGILATPVEGLTLSASILDLGGIVWYYGNAGVSEGSTSFTGVTDLSLEQIQKGDILGEFNELGERFFESLRIKTAKSRVSPEMIPFTVNTAAKYEMPFYRALSIGATGNFIFRKGMSYMEGRGVLAWNGKYLGICADGGYGSFGPVYGLGLNASIWKFRITAAMSNGFGGNIPYTNTPLKPNNKVITLGLTYDL